MAIREKNLPQSFGSKGVNYFARKLSYVMEKKRQPSIKGVNPLASIKERGVQILWDTRARTSTKGRRSVFERK